MQSDEKVFRVSQLGINIFFGVVFSAMCLVGLIFAETTVLRVVMLVMFLIIVALAVMIPSRVVYFENETIKVKFYGLLPAAKKEEITVSLDDIKSVEYIITKGTSSGVNTKNCLIRLHIKDSDKHIDFSEMEPNYKKVIHYLVDYQRQGKLHIKRNTLEKLIKADSK